MYIGSIRFFKHLIYFVLSLMILAISFFIFSAFMLIRDSTNDGKDKTDIAATESIDNSGQIEITSEKKEDKESAEVSLAAESTEPLEEPETDPSAEEPDPEASDDKSYQLLYPDLYCEKPDETSIQENTIYLTFDDGPSERTTEILNILYENNVKATFFLIGKNDEYSKQLMCDIVNDGHSIGIHSYSHKYDEIYSSVEAFLKDFNDMYNLIYEATGIKSNIFRFPGGSVNGYNVNTYKEIIEEMTRRGFTYYDWNVDSVDTSPDATAQTIKNNVMNEVSIYTRSIVLFHDSKYKSSTVSSLDGIIKALKDKGYTFDKLTNEVEPIIFNLG